MSIDFTKPLQTRDGRKVRLLCTDASGRYPIVCLYEDTKDVLRSTKPRRACTILDMSSAEFRAIFKEKP